jgi:RpiR family carbohydrate utilization transcriptional regulator
LGLRRLGRGGEDLAHKLMRVCRGVVARSDPHLQAMAAAALDGDASRSASPAAAVAGMVEVAGLAAAAGATVLAITRPGSPLAAIATTLIPCEVEDGAGLHARWSPACHLALGDALAVAAALLSPPAAEERASRVETALRQRLLPD